jgi:hypothetical protein
MGCCGKKRQALNRAKERQPVKTGPVDRSNPVPPKTVEPESEIVFGYAGSTGLSIRGPISGQLYEFRVTGRNVKVDARDAPYLQKISQLHLNTEAAAGGSLPHHRRKPAPWPR